MFGWLLFASAAGCGARAARHEAPAQARAAVETVVREAADRWRSAPTLPGDETVLARIAAAPASPCTESELPVELRERSLPPPEGCDLHKWRTLSADVQRVVLRAGRGCDFLSSSLMADALRVAVTRGQAAGADIVVYRSFRSTPDASYRVSLKREGGRLEDLWLGFSESRPWVVVDLPGLALLDGDVLQIGVDRLELDDRGYPLRGRDKQGLMLRCPLAELRRDTDGDGLTDLEEGPIVTDPRARDTDGDGLEDGADPAPLGAARPAGAPDEVWVAAFRELVAPEAEGELLVTETGGTRLDVRGVRVRLVSLLKPELEAYKRRFGSGESFSMSILVRDPDHADVVLHKTWSGGVWAATRFPQGSQGWTLRLVADWLH
jgi:hypothetical protein